MSTEERDEAIAIDVGSDEDRDAVLAEALTHTAILEARYRGPLTDTSPPRSWKTPLAMVVFFLSAYLLIAPPAWLTGEDFPLPSRSVKERGIKSAIFIQAQQVEAFRVRQGRLPSSLEELENALPGIRFVRSNSRVYQLVAPGVDGPAFIYDSARPINYFAAAAEGWGPDRP